MDGVVVKEAEIVKQRTMLGRRPYNDIVIDNLAVSGEHAALHMRDNVVEIEDLRSTNGTYVNGKCVARQQLCHGDAVEVGRYTMRFYNQPIETAEHSGFHALDFSLAGAPPPQRRASAPSRNPYAQAAAPLDADETQSDRTERVPLMDDAPAAPVRRRSAVVRFLSGPTSGQEVPLTKVVTTFGKPGLAVASVTHRHSAFVLAHVEGAEPTTLNGSSLLGKAVALKDGDLVRLAGAQMQFVLH